MNVTSRQAVGIVLSETKLALALSLVSYVAPEDARLPRDQFLRKVMDRIVDDLSAPIEHGQVSA
jgi:hypothetical protein